MTVQEAVERLKGSYGFAKSFPRLTDKGGDQHLIIHVESLGKAIKALEAYDEYKRLKDLNTPKKPKTDKFKIFHCPSCKKEIMWDTDYGQQMTDYCADCGQAIDWSDVKE